MIVLLLQYKDICDFNNFIKRFNKIYDTSIREKCISHVFSFNIFYTRVLRNFPFQQLLPCKHDAALGFNRERESERKREGGWREREREGGESERGRKRERRRRRRRRRSRKGKLNSATQFETNRE